MENGESWMVHRASWREGDCRRGPLAGGLVPFSFRPVDKETPDGRESINRRSQCPINSPCLSLRRQGSRSGSGSGISSLQGGTWASPYCQTSAPVHPAKHSDNPQVSPLERGDQGPTGGRSSRGEERMEDHEWRIEDGEAWVVNGPS
jgi:hypothetical protein